MNFCNYQLSRFRRERDEQITRKLQKLQRLPDYGEGKFPSNLMETFAFNKTILNLMKNANISGLPKYGTNLKKIINDKH